MSTPSPTALEAISLARSGDFEAALSKARAALAGNQRDGGLHLFVGLLLSRLLKVDDALEHFRAAVEIEPRDPAARVELARALLATDNIREAEAVLAQGGLPPREEAKLRGALLSQKGDPQGAAAIFRQLVTHDPKDFESFNQLGASLLCANRPVEAAAAFDASLRLRDGQNAIWDKWVDAMIAAGAGEEALAGLDDHRHGSALPAARLLEKLERPDEAIAAVEQFASDNPSAIEGIVMLADMLERRNRLSELTKVIVRITALAPDHPRLSLLRAKLAQREKRFAEARRFATESSALEDPGTRFQLIGEASDRLGDCDAAWAAFVAMNAQDWRTNASARDEAEAYQSTLAQEAAKLTDQWAGQWRESEKAATTPVALIGFPRSGTTLLDTFLSAHPGLFVSEENPLMPTLAESAGSVADLPAMADDRIAQLRAVYWAAAARMLPERGDRRLVDKYPFGLVAAPYLHRLFPGMPILLVLRHPLDVVLSGFMTRFQPTGAPAGFGDLELTARLYDRVMEFWVKSRAVLPLNVLDIRYEDMVADTEGEMRRVADFLELEWVEGMTENRTAARDRGLIKTPSYAQVSEPVYHRSVERWRNYRQWLEPVIPILRPWIDAFGYTL